MTLPKIYSSEFHSQTDAENHIKTMLMKDPRGVYLSRVRINDY